MKNFAAFAAILAAITLGLFLSSCADPAVVEGQREIAGELRSLRVALLKNAERQGGTVATPQQFDRAGLTAAMEPMREVMTALVRDMDTLQTQQTALTGELKRWSQLLAQVTINGGGGAKSEDVTALVNRLQELETQMQAQDVRHREVEGLLTRALNSTADRLEDFLKRLEGIQPPADPEAATNPNDGTDNGATPKPAGANKSNGGEPEEASSPANVKDTTPNEPRDQRVSSARRAGSRTTSTFWFGVAAVALLAGGVFALWLGRENGAAVAEPRSLEPGAVPDDSEEGVRELWAAAALLGEAVGRLREDGDSNDVTALPDPPEPEPAQAAGSLDLDDFFVIDEGPVELPERPADDVAAPLDEPPAASTRPTESTEPTAPATTGPAASPEPVGPHAITGPDRVTVRLVAADAVRSMDAILAILAADSRVLRRPEASVLVAGRALEVTFAVLPQLPAGERAHLELLVRDSVV